MDKDFLTVIYADTFDGHNLSRLINVLSKLRVVGDYEVEPRYLGYDAYNQHAVRVYLNIVPEFSRDFNFDTNVIEIAVATR